MANWWLIGGAAVAVIFGAVVFYLAMYTTTFEKAMGMEEPAGMDDTTEPFRRIYEGYDFPPNGNGNGCYSPDGVPLHKPGCEHEKNGLNGGMEEFRNRRRGCH